MASNLTSDLSTADYRRHENLDGNVFRIHEIRRRRRLEYRQAISMTKSNDESARESCDNLKSTSRACSTLRTAKGANDNPNEFQDHLKQRIVSKTAKVHKSPGRYPVVLVNPSRDSDAGSLIENSSSLVDRTHISVKPCKVDQAYELTPPPTPHLQRLSTPELPDLESTSFCPCCQPVAEQLCTLCKKKFSTLF
jgi:hypothetical protein